jgi:AraC-like DNA-binding protein
MSCDTLSDVLRAIRLRGGVFFYVEGTDPWVVETPCSSKIVPAIMPEVEHLMPFHGVARGSCWASLVDGEPIRLNEGDLVLFPQGDHHVMSSTPGLRAKVVDPDLYFAKRPPQLPFTLSLTENGMIPASRFDSSGSRLKVVCGFLGCDARPFNPLLASMPRVMRLPGLAAEGSSWVANFLHSMVEESTRKRPGGEAVLERMSEMLFVEALRCYIETLPAGETGWLAGVRDQSIGRVLALVHERPEAPWTLQQLADEAAMSRTTLHERFVQFIGQPPMQYLAQWRMQVATKLLRDTEAKLIKVALGVGYDSEAAFSRAFKRAVGVAPGAWRVGRRAVKKAEHVVS